MAESEFAGVEFVAIGQGNAVHAAHVYRFHNSEVERLGAKCDRTGFANAGYGRKVHAVKAEKVTCRSCLKIIAAKGD